MNTSTTNIAQNYASLLYPLSKEVKIDIVRLLMNSITVEDIKEKEADEEKLDRLFGCWANDPDMGDIEEKIKESRTSGKTRKLISFD